jgi:hypothetical protein
VNTLRKISAATILSLILAVSAFAGQIETHGAPAPAPTTNITTFIVLTIVSLIYR